LLAFGALFSLLLAGCKPPVTGGKPPVTGSNQPALRLVVQTPFNAGSITTDDVAVTRLDLNVTGTGFSYSVTWVPADGMKQYDVSLPEAGTYTVEAIHRGVKGDGYPISASESKAVLVQPLIISVVSIVPGQILAVLVANLELGRFGQARWGQAIFGP
jgi:hypothetical protein